jgi:hypothetical protein
MTENKQKDVDPQADLGGMGCLTRILWIGVGNMALVFSATFIAQGHYASFSKADMVFWITVVLMVLIRYVDITRFQGLTAQGHQPATLAQWRRYVVLLIVISSLLWLLAHGIAYLIG